MDFSWTDLLGVGAAISSGGLFGLLGSVIGVASKWLQRKQELELETARTELDIRRMRVQMEVASQQGSWDGLTSSQQSETAINSQPTYRWVVALKSLFRPALTVLLWLTAWLVFVKITDGSLEEWIETPDITDLIRYMVYSTFFAASTATVWWFGDRALNPPELKNR